MNIISIEISKVSFFEFISEIRQIVQYKLEIELHALCHTFATRCIENGMQPQVLKSILGHSSLAMTMVLYSRVLPDTKSKEMKKISDLF